MAGPDTCNHKCRFINWLQLRWGGRALRRERATGQTTSALWTRVHLLDGPRKDPPEFLFSIDPQIFVALIEHLDDRRVVQSLAQRRDAQERWERRCADEAAFDA